MADTTTTQRRLRFERLVREAEASIAADPRAYRLQIVLLALLGYGVLFGAVALLVALIGGAVWGALASTAFLLLLLKKKLIIPLLAVIWVILRSLWVRIEAPTGYPAQRVDFPALHAEVQALRRQLRTPPVHEIILTEDFNAAVAQTPRLGVLGWDRNTVILGLPLLLALTPEQARAVLAHEFGHLSGNHSRFSAWIYRLRLTWYRVMLAFDQAHGFSTALLRRFFDWYAPYFNARSFALARGNEYEADAISARLTSVNDAAQALVSTHIRSDLIHEHYWQPLLRRAESSPEPEPRPFTGLARFLRESTPPPRQELLERIRKAVTVETDHANTHPALRDRLSAMNAPPVLPGNIERSAAEEWLAARLPGVLELFDRSWLERNREAWQQRFEYVKQARDKLAELGAKPEEELTREERWNLAAWTEEFVPERDALPLYRAYAQHAPEDRDADFVMGRILLTRNDPEGLDHLERAMQEFRHALPACELACDYFHRIGDKNQADLWRRRGERAIDLAPRAAERESLSAADTFLPSDLLQAEHDLLRDQLTAFDQIKHAWIAKKRLEHLREHSLYVVAVKPSGLLTNADKLVEELAQKIDTDAMTYFVATEGDSGAVGKKVAKFGTQLF